MAALRAPEYCRAGRITSVFDTGGAIAFEEDEVSESSGKGASAVLLSGRGCSFMVWFSSLAVSLSD